MADASSFYITTPIFYVNDVPHIGHAYTEVAADVLARWHRQAGDDTWMLTGTDEHGQKILRTATANGVTPQEWADKLVDEAWKPLLETIDIANDDFIRTTDERHERQRRRSSCRSSTTTATSTPASTRATTASAARSTSSSPSSCRGTRRVRGAAGLRDPLASPSSCCTRRTTSSACRRSPTSCSPSTRSGPTSCSPSRARNEVVSFVKQGLADLSISRSTFDWGVKVPWDESHVVYVWFDALLNYITAVGYGAGRRGVRPPLARRSTSSARTSCASTP